MFFILLSILYSLFIHSHSCLDVQTRRPENTNDIPFVTAAQKAAELFSMTIDGRQKQYHDTTYENVRKIFQRIQECTFLDKIYMIDDCLSVETSNEENASEHDDTTTQDEQQTTAVVVNQVIENRELVVNNSGGDPAAEKLTSSDNSATCQKVFGNNNNNTTTTAAPAAAFINKTHVVMVQQPNEINGVPQQQQQQQHPHHQLTTNMAMASMVPMQTQPIMQQNMNSSTFTTNASTKVSVAHKTAPSVSTTTTALHNLTRISPTPPVHNLHVANFIADVSNMACGQKLNPGNECLKINFYQ